MRIDGVELRGPITIQKVSTKPAHAGSSDEGRLIYCEDTGIMWYGQAADWAQWGTSGTAGSSGSSGSSGTSGEAGSSGSSGSSGTSGEAGGGTTWESKTSSFNATKDYGYLVDTTSSSITSTLPGSPSFGDTITFCDAAGTFHLYSLVLGANGNKIMGLAEDMTISSQYSRLSVVYYDSTNGWRVYQ